MTLRVRAAAACLTAAAAVVACSSSKTAAPGGSPTVSPSAPGRSSAVSCPPAKGSAAWPQQAPKKLPVPAGLRVVSVQEKPNVVIRFTVPDDFHNTVRYLLAALPKAGFTLGTGDSEAEEADIPFAGAGVHASIKINDKGPCMTGGLLAVAS